MNKIVVIGLGPGDENFLTLEAVKNLSIGDRRTFLRTEFHPTVSYLNKENIEYSSYDEVYESADQFSEVYETIVQNLIDQSKKYETINYCVPGHPLIAEKTVDILIEYEKRGEVELEIVQGLSFIEPVILSMETDPVNGLKIIDGLDIENQRVDINMDNLITQVYNRSKASELKLKLSEIYGDEYELYVIKSAGIAGEEIKEKCAIYQMDRLDWIDHLTSVYIPKVSSSDKEVYDFNDLLNIMSKLRSVDGCPWDIKQTHGSLKKYVIEEAYELVEAIEEEDIDGIIEELGDLLLQVVFHSQIGLEEGYFNIGDVLRSISEKMINRHPNVFQSYIDDKSEKTWDEIKAEEKAHTTYEERLRNVPKVLPALIRSMKVQKRASDVGFDWESIDGPRLKVEEELEELYDEIKNKGENIEEEMGDLLFSIVNMSRFLNIDAERALYLATEKFIDRFSRVEQEIMESDRDIRNVEISELELVWEKVKKSQYK